MQVVETESTFTIHHANAFEDPDAPGDILIWSNGWGPATLAAVAARAKAAKEKVCAAVFPLTLNVCCPRAPSQHSSCFPGVCCPLAHSQPDREAAEQ
jgi:hypothetical protein